MKVISLDAARQARQARQKQPRLQPAEALAVRDCVARVEQGLLRGESPDTHASLAYDLELLESWLQARAQA